MNKFILSIKEMLKDPEDPRIIQAINLDNIRTARILSDIIGVLESILLIIYFAAHRFDPSVYRSYGNVLFCILVCVFINTYARKAENNPEESLNGWKSNGIITMFYILLSIWGMLADYPHYIDGLQILTFFIVEFCCVNFLVFRPKFGIPAIFSIFLAFYIAMYFGNGAYGIIALNYLFFLIIAPVNAAFRYRHAVNEKRDLLRVQELNHTLQNMAEKDPLTEVKNRYSLQIEMPELLHKRIYVIMSDIDYFKKFNDTYGHVTGDQVLRDAAKLFQTYFGQKSVYRYGGDEFLVIAPLSESQDIQRMIEDWTDAVARLKVEGVDEQIHCSYGLAEGIATSKEEFEQLIEYADSKLYNAKRQRDQNNNRI